MSKTQRTFTVVSGDNEWPLELSEAIGQLRARRSELQKLAKPLREQIDNLSTDWSIRSSAFWQRVLETLQALLEALGTWSAWWDALDAGNKDRARMIYLPIYWQAMSDLHKAVKACEDAAIAVTAYQPVCSSMEVLYQRRDVLNDLKGAGTHVTAVVSITGSANQKRCIEGYLRSLGKGGQL